MFFFTGLFFVCSFAYQYHGSSQAEKKENIKNDLKIARALTMKEKRHDKLFSVFVCGTSIFPINSMYYLLNTWFDQLPAGIAPKSRLKNHVQIMILLTPMLLLKQRTIQVTRHESSAGRKGSNKVVLYWY